jgi:signal transduction histidine kinase
VGIKSKDEFGRLSDSFNKMVSELKEAREKIADYERSLEKKVKEKSLGLEEAQKELRAMDRVKSEFLDFVAHELKTPLTPLTGYTQLLSEGKLGRISKKQKEGLKIMEKDIVRLRSLIDKIVSMTTLEAGKVELSKEKAELTPLIQKVILNMKPLAKEKDIDLIVDVGKLPLVNFDRVWLNIVLINLIDNAIKFTRKGYVKLEVRVVKNNVLFKIKDTGVGIAKKHLKELFTKFFQVSRTVPGYGLGLAICKKVIKEHDGKIWVKSTLRKGTTVYFTLPIK